MKRMKDKPVIIDIESKPAPRGRRKAAPSGGKGKPALAVESTAATVPDEAGARKARLRARMRNGMARVASAARQVGAAAKGLRDTAVEAGAAAWINQKIERFGALTDLRIHSEARSVFLQVQLRGESDPLTIRILGYRFQREGDKDFLVMIRAETSREWVTEVLAEFVLYKRFEVPAAVRVALS